MCSNILDVDGNDLSIFFQVKLCDSLGSWLTNSAFKDIADQTSIPISDHVRRLLADCYICFYASADYPLYV